MARIVPRWHVPHTAFLPLWWFVDGAPGLLASPRMMTHPTKGAFPAGSVSDGLAKTVALRPVVAWRACLDANVSRAGATGHGMTHIVHRAQDRGSSWHGTSRIGVYLPACFTVIAV
jgi:hypothetical protein